MLKIAIIGSGHIGTALLKGFITSGYIQPANIIVSNRTFEKLLPVRETYEYR